MIHRGHRKQRKYFWQFNTDCNVAADDSPNWLTLRETEVAESDQDCIVFLVECSVEKISKENVLETRASLVTSARGAKAVSGGPPCVVRCG